MKRSMKQHMQKVFSNEQEMSPSTRLRTVHTWPEPAPYGEVPWYNGNTEEELGVRDWVPTLTLPRTAMCHQVSRASFGLSP